MPAIAANECLAREIPAVENAVQRQYRKMLTAFPTNLPEPEAKRLLEASHKAWLSYRTSHCRYIGQVDGGVVYKGVYEGFCLLGTATRRLGELQELGRAPTSNVGWPAPPFPPLSVVSAPRAFEQQRENEARAT